MATYLVIALVLVGIGLACLVGEFAFPTGGIFLVVSLTLFAVAAGVVWWYGSTLEATIAIIGFCTGVPAVGWLSVQAWKSLALKRGLDPLGAGGSITQVMAELSELDTLNGATGKTLTPMRPSGLVEFNGRRVDALTEGLMLDADTPVRCVEIKAGRVIVRKIDKAAPTNDFDFNEPDTQ
jgi:membrane-bound ClpP family serine protease